jgi:acetoin utilization deacetylase AcuC-like enzyme
MPLTLFSHARCALHNPDPEHPERPARLHAINDQLVRSGLEFVIKQVDARPAEASDLYRAHSKLYVDELFAKAPTEGHIWLDPDTPMTPKSLAAALLAAGSGLQAVDEVMQADNQQAFCAIRPPGHHATHDQAMGFCLFNNIAVAASYALDKYQLQRIAIIDFDVHHGNGTEDIFSHDDRVLFCSSFQQALYPNTGDESSTDRILNLPLPAGCKGMQWRRAVSECWFDALDAFAPQLIFISAGFDGHAEDDMSQFLLKEDDYGWLTAELKQLANRHCQGRMVSMLEGGYDLSSLGRSVVAHLKAML